MINDNNHNPSCDFAEQIVSFLYDEIGETEKSKFQSHLRNCSSCANEVAEFSVVRSSIQEWRINDFENLSTPAFAMPATKNALVEKTRWFDLVRSYLSFSPALAAAAGIVVIMAVAALVWFNSNSLRNNEVASNKGEKPVETIPSPREINIAKDSAVATKHDQNDIKISEPVKESVSVKNEPSKIAPAPIKVAERVNTSKTQVVKSKKQLPVVANRINDKKSPKSFNKNNIPSLIAEDTEDESLRLSDILNEIGMR